MGVNGGVFVLQEAMAGKWSDEVSDELVGRLLDCQSMHRDRGAAIGPEPWGAFILRTLREGADGWALHEPLRGHSQSTRRVLNWVERIGADTSESCLPDKDLVHLDFHHRNVLQGSDGKLSAVIDWEGARQGDAAFDLVTLAFGLAVARCGEPTRQRVWEAARRASGDALPAYVAHMALRRLDWTIRSHPDKVPFWLDACRTFIRHTVG